MSLILLWLAVLLVGSLLAGLGRILSGPTASDRMLAAQLLGTSGVGVLLLLAEALELPPLRDVALVFALLAAIGAIGFVHRAADAPLTSEPLTSAPLTSEPLDSEPLDSEPVEGEP